MRSSRSEKIIAKLTAEQLLRDAELSNAISQWMQVGTTNNLLCLHCSYAKLTLNVKRISAKCVAENVDKCIAQDILVEHDISADTLTLIDHNVRKYMLENNIEDHSANIENNVHVNKEDLLRVLHIASTVIDEVNGLVQTIPAENSSKYHNMCTLI